MVDFSKITAQRAAAKTAQRPAPVKQRRWVVGFGPTTIPPNSTVNIMAQPRCLFRGEALINTEDEEGLFIQNLFVGSKCQFPVPSHGIPVSKYGSNKGCVDLHAAEALGTRTSLKQFLNVRLGAAASGIEKVMDICHPALAMTFQIENRSAVTATWGMSIIGLTVL